MEFYPIDFVIHILNIVVLFVLVRSLAYKPIRKFMREREEKIAAQLAEAEAAQSSVDTLKAEYQAGLDNAAQERESILAASHSEAVKEADAIRAEARQQAEAIVRQGKLDAERAAENVMRAAEGELAGTAVELAGRVLCFNEAARANAMAMHPVLEGSAAGVVKLAAHPDTVETKEICTVLENLTGKHLSLKMEHDESLLGGFVAYIEGAVYDFSYASQLKELQRKLS